MKIQVLEVQEVQEVQEVLEIPQRDSCLDIVF